MNFDIPILNMPKIILFDMDGTLVDNSEVVAEAYYQGMIKLGYRPTPKNKIKRLFGKSTFDTGRGLGLREEDLEGIDALFWEFFGNYASSLEGSPNIYESVPELLKLAKGNKILMGICTSNESKSARILMEKAQLDSYFNVYIGSEDLKERKPSPQPLRLALEKLKFNYRDNNQLKNDIWFVGDTKYDIEAAHNAGMFAIGITHESTAELMIGSEPDMLVDSISDLYQFILQSWK